MLIEPEAVAAAVRELAQGISGEVSTTSARRAQYSSDASNYRVPPAAVVFPRTVDELLTVTEVARRHRIPVTMRGGGTSVAGNAIGPGLVVDTSRHLDRILAIDPDARTATVEPGVVVARLNAAVAAHGLRFGPDPSTHTRATMGGLIGNNACGAHALGYGRTADNVIGLEVVDGRGRRFTAGSGLDPVPGLAALVGSELELLRLEFGRFGRQISGYGLEHLLPERGSNLAGALVGSEGTVVTVLGATVRLVPLPPSTALVVLGYPDMAAAADAVPALSAHRPLAVEGIDRRLVEVVRRHLGAVPELPAGGGWLMVELGGESPGEATASARRLVADAGTAATRVLPAGPEAAALWRIREDGAGLAGRTAAGAQAWPGWEDAAVPPERLGAYLREFEGLLAEFGVTGLPYGHFGDGCLHVRIDLPLDSDGRPLREFTTAAADLVAAHGGSLSGEHGDGRARSELLGRMYSPAALELMRRFKGLLDPDDLLNPGIIVDPAPVDADLRRPAARPLLAAGGFAFADDGGDLTRAVHRCVGVGKCRAVSGSGFMCPSYQATADENDVTRGRARVLQELAIGTLVSGWDAPEVEQALDLCLSCKACARDCPAGVDMARYRSEVLFRRYRGRLRPLRHYVLGRLPLWLGPAGWAPGLVNAIGSVPVLRRLGMRAVGIDPRRGFPRLASRSRRRRPPVVPGPGQEVLLWTDTFTAAYRPETVAAAVRVLTEAGCTVRFPARPACCGLTWISTGQLTGARRRLTRLLDVLGPAAEAGVPIVGLEPSCTAVLRSDLLDLLPDDPRAHQVAAATRTLAELLAEQTRWAPTDLAGRTVIAQPHCHQHAVLGYDADLALLRRAGAAVTALSGCCGLAGNFGMERGHYDLSVAVAQRSLLPALRSMPAGAVLLADGFSCRTQAADLGGIPAVTLPELLSPR